MSIKKTITFCEDCSVFETDDPVQFKNAIDAAKKECSYSTFLHSYSLEEYSEMRLFLISHNMGGIAVKKNGDIVSVFKNPTLAKKYNLDNVSGKLLFAAINAGGCKLDCYDGFLPNLYVKYGFVPVCKVKFKNEVAPQNWNYERDKKPDVIFFMHNGDRVEEIITNSKNYPKYKYYVIPYITDFKTASKYRDQRLAKRKRAKDKSLHM